jgi:restriction system protein
MTLWVVKGGRGGILEERFLARSVIGIGWGELGDLSSYPDRATLRAAYRGSFPGRSESHVNTQVAQLWAFAARMQVGDIVVVPFLGRQEIAVGEIRGPYRWLRHGDADMPHVRKVSWETIDVPRVAFDPDLRYSFGGSVTVCSVRRNDAERRVRTMIWGLDDRT